jgi:hypothetical protein
MDHKTVILIVEVELDYTPGIFHTPESAKNAVEHILQTRIPHYNPKVQIQKD